MLIYYLLFALTLLLSYFAIAKDFPTSVVGALVFVLVGMVVTLAYGTNDYFSYRSIYDGITSLDGLNWLGYSVNIATPIEPGFALAILLEKNLTNSFVVFWFVFTAASLLIKFVAFKELSPFLILTILLYLSDEYFWKDLSGIRGAMASGFVLISMLFAYRQQPLRFGLMLLMGMSFHFAALVALPIYWYRLFGRRAILALMFLASSTVAALGGVGLLLPEIASSMGMDTTSRLIKYSQSQYVTGISPFGGTFLIHLVIVTSLLAMYVPLVKAWKYNHVLITAYVYGTVLMFTFIDYGIIAGRIREMLCIPVGAVLLPTFLLLVRGRQRLVPYCGVIAYALLWFFLMTRDRAPYSNVLFAT